MVVDSKKNKKKNKKRKNSNVKKKQVNKNNTNNKKRNVKKEVRDKKIEKAVSTQDKSVLKDDIDSKSEVSIENKGRKLQRDNEIDIDTSNVDTDNSSVVKNIDRKKKLFSYILFSIIGLLLIFYITFPKIYLNGKKKVIISYDQEYKEQGYKGKVLGLDVTNRIYVESNITNKIGTYEVNYKIKYFFITIKKTRWVMVVDNKKPEIKVIDESIKICPNESVPDISYTAIDEYDGDLTDKVEVFKYNNKIILKVSDSSYNTEDKVISVINEDKEGPKITLKGYQTMYVGINEGYKEPGYMASDNCDGDLTDKVMVSGEVLDKIGTYMLTYKVTDSSGNDSSITRTVIVGNNTLVNDGTINSGTIYLTFDDGPNEGTTGYILDVLKEENVKATFFVTCNGPDYLIKRMYDEGHTVALHTATHNYSYVYSSIDNYFTDLQRVSDRVKNITGVDSKIIRFPGGSSNTVSRNYRQGIMTELTYMVIDKGYRYYDWNVDSNDAGSAKTSSEVYNNVVSHLSRERSNVVLMHDVKYTTKGAIKDIIKYAKDNGYNFDKITMDTYMVRHGVNN